MGKRNSDNGIDGIFPSLSSRSAKDKKEAQDLKASFLKEFERQWRQATVSLKQELIHRAGELEIEYALRPVIIALRDPVLRVREEAKKCLERLARQATISTRQGQELPPAVVKRSGQFSFALYREMKAATGNLELTRFFLYTLVKIGGIGPFLCWKFFVQGLVPHNIIVEMLRKFPEQMRLLFVHQYTLDEIAVRKLHDQHARLLLKDIHDRKTVVEFLSDLFDEGVHLDQVFDDLCQRMKIREWVIEKDLKSKHQKERIRGIRVIGALGQPSGYHTSLALLSPNEEPPVRIACLEMLSRTHAGKDARILETVSGLLDDKDKNVALHAFRALVSLKAPGLGRAACDLVQNHPPIRSSLFESLCDLSRPELNSILDLLTPDQRRDARMAIVGKITRNRPERLIALLNQYAKGSDNGARKQALGLIQKIEAIREKEAKDAVLDDTPGHSTAAGGRKGLLAKMGLARGRGRLKRLVRRESVKGADFGGQSLSGLDLSGIEIHDVGFDGALLNNVDLSSAKLHSVTFRGARFENVKMDGAWLDSVSFENAVVKNVSAGKATFNSCDFTDSWIYGSSLDSSTFIGSLFIGATIKKTDFSRADLTETSFVDSRLSAASFKSACLDISDFSLARAKACDFSGVDTSSVVKGYAELDIRSGLFRDVSIPPSFLEDDMVKAGGFDIVVLSEEMEKLDLDFRAYNRRRTDLALDTFRPEQIDLFELVPFLVDSGSEFISTGDPVRNAPAGILEYCPSKRTLRRAKKYFIIDDDSITDPGKEAYIEGLFTIGSIGTIAQSADSDIDYWVCVDEVRLGEEGLDLLKKKLAAIEEWALKVFHVEIHFFVVDLASVREDRFGASDKESSGSAQGKILKEEFYRTMILVAGKVPLWCVTPEWLDDEYQYLLTLEPGLCKDYLDLGKVSNIPTGEYFGASIWQIFKSLKSPYKSVMKMSLLDKYVQEEQKNGLLCNRLKEAWSSGHGDLRRHDPYLLLFEEVLRYYRRAGQVNAESLLKVCFFLKLGIRSIADLDESVIGVRKRVVQDYIERWGWDELKVQDLGRFRSWQFDKIFRLSTNINRYMIETYKNLSRAVRETQADEMRITQEDLTMLGRKMFVQFSKQPHKVERLPLIVHGRALFQQLYLDYSQPAEGQAAWVLYHLKRGTRGERDQGKMLKKMKRVEEIVIWLVHNGLYSPTTSLELVPNPTPISIQDIIDLLRALSSFFAPSEIESLSPRALLEKPRVQKLFVAINFNLSRKLSKIHEYTAIYMTTWGELFCRVFVNKEGVGTREEMLRDLRGKLGLPMSGGRVGFHVPHFARKRIK